MDIAALSTASSSVLFQTEASTLVMKKVLDNTQEEGQSAIDLLSNSGQIVDIQA